MSASKQRLLKEKHAALAGAACQKVLGALKNEVPAQVREADEVCLLTGRTEGEYFSHTLHAPITVPWRLSWTAPYAGIIRARDSGHDFPFARDRRQRSRAAASCARAGIASAPRSTRRSRRRSDGRRIRLVRRRRAGPACRSAGMDISKSSRIELCDSANSRPTPDAVAGPSAATVRSTRAFSVTTCRARRLSGAGSARRTRDLSTSRSSSTPSCRAASCALRAGAPRNPRRRGRG